MNRVGRTFLSTAVDLFIKKADKNVRPTRSSLTMGKAVSHAVSRISAGIDGKRALQFVMSGSVQEIADCNHASHSSSEKD